MDKKELVKEISGRAGISEKDAAAVLNAFTTIVTDEMASGKKLSVFGLGAFEVAARAARTGRNPRTGEPVEIAAKKAVHFKPAKQLKDAVNG